MVSFEAIFEGTVSFTLIGDFHRPILLIKCFRLSIENYNLNTQTSTTGGPPFPTSLYRI